MEEEQEESLWDLVQKVRFLYEEDIDFARTDPDALLEIVQRIANAAFCFNILAITDYGGRTGRERTPGLVEQVIGAAFQTYAGEDPHPHPFQKAAMLLRGITQGHPFADGNKRTGFMVVMYYLEQVGYKPSIDRHPTSEVVDFCLQVSAGEIRDIETIAANIARFWTQPFA